MFDTHDSQRRAQKNLYQNTGFSSLKDASDQSFHLQVEAQKEYVSRLKIQRQKIESLYSKYDVLLKDLKNKDCQLKQRDRNIANLQMKCKNLIQLQQQSSMYKDQNLNMKSQNLTLQKAYSQLEENYYILQNQLKAKENINGHKFEQIQNLNGQLLLKLKSLTKKYQQKQQQFNQKYKQLNCKFEDYKLQSKKQKQNLNDEIQTLRSSLLQRQQQCRLLQIQCQCLKQRLYETQNNLQRINLQFEQKLICSQREKKSIIRSMKNQYQSLKDINNTLQKKLAKSKQEISLKQISLNQMNILVTQHDKQNSQATHLLKIQFSHQKNLLKQQIIQYQNHIAKLQRKIADLIKREVTMSGKIKKYEICLDAKRNFRQIEKQELQKINFLLSSS